MAQLFPADRFFEVNGLRLHALDWGGDGPPLLLLHGFAAHAHAWDTLSIALQPHFRVLALDQRGHGQSDEAEMYSPEHTEADVAAVMAQLDIRRFFLIGLSMGGRNAMLYAARHPEQVEKLVVIDIGPEIRPVAQTNRPAPPPEPEAWDNVEQVAQHLLAGNPYPGIHYYRWVAQHSLRERPDGKLEWLWRKSIRERRGGGEIDWWGVLRAIQCPTLVLRGAESPILDAEQAERMATELAHGQYVEIPRAVHTLHEDNPTDVLAALRVFFGIADR